MFRKMFSCGGLLLVAAAVVFVTPGPGHAQRVVGRFGGGRFGGYGSDVPAYYRPGNRYRPYDGYSLYAYRYGNVPYAYDLYPSLWSPADYGPGYYGIYGSELPSYSADGATDVPSARPDATARITVSLPPSAEVWFEGTKTTSTGSIREYQSPPLTPGAPYTYEIRARWSENGRDVDQTQTVAVTAGGHVTVGFPVSSTTGGPATTGG